jgi:hypothetical protein
LVGLVVEVEAIQMEMVELQQTAVEQVQIPALRVLSTQAVVAVANQMDREATAAPVL